MKRRVRILAAFAAGTLAFVVGTSTVHATTLTSVQLKCQQTIAKEAAKFLSGELKLRQKSRETCLAKGVCSAPDQAKLDNLGAKLAAGLAKGCPFTTPQLGNLKSIGFPGPCIDPSPLTTFTVGDLVDCIANTHQSALTGECQAGTNLAFCSGMLGVEYDASLTPGSLTGTALKCQKEIAKDSAKYVAALLKNIQKCRNDLLDCRTDPQTDITTCKLSGFLAKDCATADTKTKNAVDKALAAAEAAIASKCSTADLTTIKACEPDKTDPTLAAACEIDFHKGLSDNPAATALDLLDFEYAKPAICGDGRKNRPSEECDGSDSGDCPGLCGAPDGLFPCLCQNVKRSRVVEHANSDLDNGFSGQSHDSGVVEGGGYVTELWDCDGEAGPDTLCSVGPSCECPLCLPGQVHASCSPGVNGNTTGDEICAATPTVNGGQGMCRRTVGGVTGPHCAKDFRKRCATGNDCLTIPDDSCITVPHSAPLPLSSGGVSVCVVNTFTEDIVGTKDLADGSGAVRLRQNSATWLGPDQQQPCPVCGGFCSGDAGPFGPGARHLCAANADCVSGVCITEPVCSWGPNRDKPCGPNTPFGGTTAFFGNPSVDCPMNGSILGQIDILFNPTTTGTVSRTANIDCGTPGFTNKTCAGGPNQHAVCTVDSECPGGTCNEQCFCGGGPQKPNGCDPACVGGANDAQPCTVNSDCNDPQACVGGSNNGALCLVESECPGGACLPHQCLGGSNNGAGCALNSECPSGICGSSPCHPADCRWNPSDTDSVQEGQCTVGPDNRTCSVHSFVTCSSDAGCKPSGTCAFCNESETCQNSRRECFVNPTIIRAGFPAKHNYTVGAIFCEAKTSSDAVNTTAGIPGPAAETTHITSTEVGFP
jgi:hypothetical protein